MYYFCIVYLEQKHVSIPGNKESFIKHYYSSMSHSGFLWLDVCISRYSSTAVLLLDLHKYKSIAVFFCKKCRQGLSNKKWYRMLQEITFCYFSTLLACVFFCSSFRVGAEVLGTRQASTTCQLRQQHYYKQGLFKGLLQLHRGLQPERQRKRQPLLN